MEDKKTFLFSKLKWVSFYRVIIAFVSLILLIYWRTKIDLTVELSYFVYTLILLFSLSLVYGILIKILKSPFPLIIFQIGVDILIVSFIIALTGGVESPFIFFYAFIVLEGGIFFSKEGAYVTSFLNIFFMGLIFLNQYRPFFPLNSPIFIGKTVYTGAELFYSFSIFSLEFLVLGLLIGYLTSETKRIRENLEESEVKVHNLEYLRNAILASISDGLVVYKEGEIPYENEMAKEILSKITSDSKEGLLKNLFGEEFEVVKREKRSLRFEKKVKNEKGEMMWLAGTISPLYDHANQTMGILITFHDLTSYKIMENNLRINDKFAFIGKLSTVIAHEIRNPLASLKGSIEFLKENLTLEEEYQKVINIVDREIDRLNKFITDFLSYSRNIELNKGTIYLHNLVTEIWYELTFSQTMRGDSIKFTFQGDRDVTITGDPNYIRQVFLNLFLNAIDAIKSTEKEEGEITVFVEETDTYTEIAIEDNGGGIDERVIEKIFDPFFTTKKNGTGLGLAIVYKIVQEHGGTISAMNTKRGAKFVMRFPK